MLFAIVDNEQCRSKFKINILHFLSINKKRGGSAKTDNMHTDSPRAATPRGIIIIYSIIIIVCSPMQLYI